METRELLNAVMENHLQHDPNRGAGTRNLYQQKLQTFVDWLGHREFTKNVVTQFLFEKEQEGLSPSTRNGYVSAIKAAAEKVTDIAEEDREVNSAERDWICLQMARIRGLQSPKSDGRKPRGRIISKEEFNKLLNDYLHDGTANGVRDAAVSAVAYHTGMRRGEISALQMSDIACTGQGYILSVLGKGRKRRTVAVAGTAEQLLADWLEIRGDRAGYVFSTIVRGGHIQYRQLHGSAMNAILKARLRKLGLEPATMHDFRRTFITNAIQRHDIALVSKMVGHAGPGVTCSYDRRDEETVLQAMAALQMCGSKSAFVQEDA